MKVLGILTLIFLTMIHCMVLPFLIRDILLILIPKLKCRGKKDCKQDSCLFRKGCKYTAFSDKEKTEMYQHISSFNTTSPSFEKKDFKQMK